MNRMSKDDLYLNVADAMLGRATCLRRLYGSVIVKNDEIISTGYNGSPRGQRNCNIVGRCKREELNVPPGERYELCVSIHAEQNAIISASRDRMIGSTMYLAGRDAKTNEVLNVTEPCLMCKRMIINAGIEKVVTRTKSGNVVYLVDDWVKDGDLI